MLQRTSLLRRICDDLCREAGFEPNVSFESEDVHTIRGLVAAGLGVAVIPASGSLSADATPGRVRYLHLTDVHAAREIGLAWPGDRRLLSAAEVFREHVIQRSKTRRLPALT